MTSPRDQGRREDDSEAVGVPNDVQGSRQGQDAHGWAGTTKRSRLVGALASEGGLRCEHGFEAGALPAKGRARVPCPMREPPVDDAETAARMRSVSMLARTLRRELLLSPELALLGCQVRVVEARVRDEALEGLGASERPLLSAQAFVGPDADRPRWTRLTIPAADPASGNPRSWPPGFVPALGRLVRAALLPPFPAAGALAECREIVLDAFALADLLRAASRRWASGRVGQPSGLPATAELDECDLLGACGDGARSPALRDGILVATPESLGTRTRVSWRERPRPDWRGLELRLADSGDPLQAPGTLLLAALDVLPGALLGGGLFVDAGGREHSLAPIALPGAEALLSALVASRGPGVPDASGLPIRTPAALLDRDRVLDALR